MYCGKWRKISHLDLDLTMPNVELVRAIYIYYNIFKLIDSLISLVIVYTDIQTERQTDSLAGRRKDKQTDNGHEYSTVAVDKPQP